MATLEKIRNKAGLLVIVVGLALFAFIIGDFLNSGSAYFRQSQEVIAEIDGEVINIQDYQLKVEEMSEVFKMQSGESSIPEEYMAQLRQNVFENFVREIVLNNATSEIGISVSPEELFDMVQGENISPMILQMPMFRNPQTEQFDKMMLLNFLKTINDENLNTYPVEQQAELQRAKSFWMFWENMLKRQKLEEKYTSLLSKAITANKLEASDAYNASANNADIAFVSQSYSTIADSTITVSESEIKKLYEQRKESYKRPEGRRVKYIAVDINPSQEDYDNARKEANALKDELATDERVADVVNENSDIPFVDVYFSENAFDAETKQFAATAEVGSVNSPIFENNIYNIYKLVDKKTGADSVQISHIMLAGESADRTTQLADSLLNVLNDNGDFAALAREFSVDQTAEQNAGDLGWFTEISALTQLGDEFSKSLFSADKGEVLIIKSQYGTHVVKITDKTKDIEKYKMANIQFAVTPSSKTYSQIYNDLNQYMSTNSDVSTVDETAKEAGYIVMPSQIVTANDPSLGTIANSRQVVRWLFQNETNKFSEIFECDDKFVVAINLEELPAGYRLMQDVAPALRRELAAKAKGEKIATDLAAKNLSSLEAYAEAIDTKIDTVKFVNFGTSRLAGIGIEPNMNAMVSIAKVGELSAPVKGNNGVYIFKVLDTKSDAVAFNEETQINTLNSANTYRIRYSAIQSLTNAIEVEDYRVKFY